MKNKTGITLIALVVTIVVLIILVAVSINVLMGENGIINQAKLAGQKTEIADIKMQIQLDLISAETQANVEGSTLTDDQIKVILEKYGDVLYNGDGSIKGVKTKPKGYEILLDDIWTGTVIEGLPENGPEIEAGTIVKLLDQWSTETMRYISTINGEELKDITKVATVYAVSDGKGNTIPIPYGFYYVGGDLERGVVISDREQDKNKYAGQSDIPSGFDLDENNNPIYTIQGNQFIWIPCTPEEYHKTAFDTKFQNANWDTTVGRAEITQIQKYGGFYVGRFEAGLATDIPEFTTTQKHTASNQVYNKEGMPEVKPGKVAWNFIDWNHSKQNCEVMYNTNYVNSGLITGTQWDVMLQKITNSDATKSLTSPNWGNYYNQQLTYTGRIAKAYLNGDWYQEKFGDYVKNATKAASSSSSPCYVLSTGSSEQAKAYNLYDVAGNLWEWTEEGSSYQTSNQFRVLRGSSYLDPLAVYPVCYRYGSGTVTYTAFTVGFRPVLYIK